MPRRPLFEEEGSLSERVSGTSPTNRRPLFEDGQVPERSSKPKGIFSKLTEFTNRGKDTIKRRSGRLKRIAGRVASGEQRLRDPETKIQLGGQVVGIVEDFVFDAIAAASPQAIDDFFNKTLKSFAETKTGQDVANIAEKYTDWAERNPQAADNIEGIVNVGGVLPVGKSGALTGKVAAKAGGAAVDVAARGVKTAGRPVRAAADIASDITPTRGTLISGNVSKALHVTPGDITNIQKSTGNDVGEFLAKNNLIKNNIKETVAAVDDVFTSSYKDVRKAVNAVSRTFDTDSVKSLDKAFTAIKGQVDGIPGLEDVSRQVDELMAKDTVSLADVQLTKELVDEQFKLFSGAGDDLFGARKEGMRNIRKDLRKFIETEVSKDFPDIDIADLNNKVSTTRGILESTAQRASRRKTLQELSISDFMIIFGVGSVSPLTGAALLLGKKALQSPAVRLRFAKWLNNLPEKPKAEAIKTLESGELPKNLPDDLKKEANEVGLDVEAPDVDAPIEQISTGEIKPHLTRSPSTTDKAPKDLRSKMMESRIIPDLKNPSNYDGPLVEVKSFGETAYVPHVETYKGRDIVLLGEDVAVWNRETGSLFIVGLDDSKVTGDRVMIDSANSVESARRYIDYVEAPDVDAPTPDVSPDLVAEARKFDSADEFVKAQGEPVYHGTNQDFEVFGEGQDGLSATKMGSAKDVFFFTDSLDEAWAYGRHADRTLVANENAFNRKYESMLEAAEKAELGARRSGDRKDWEIADRLQEDAENFYFEGIRDTNSNERVITSYLDVKNPLVHNANGQITSGEVQELIKRAKESGNDGVILKNVSDNPEGTIDFRSNHTIVFQSDKIKTKEQLTDIWNKANEVDLVAEARKFDSADEFVKAQQPISQFTDIGKEGKFWTIPEGADEGFGSVRKDAFIDESKIFKGVVTSREFLEERGLLTEEMQSIIDNAWTTPNPNIEWKVTQDAAEKVLKAEGFSGAKWIGEDELNPTQWQVWGKEVIKTKQQLTDIWNKANEVDLVAEARKFDSAEEFVKSSLDRHTVTNPSPITVYRGEGSGIGNETLVSGRYFADSEDFAGAFGDVTEYKNRIPADTRMFDLDTVKTGDDIIPPEALVDTAELTDFLMDHGYSYTRNSNSRGVEYVELRRSVGSESSIADVDMFNVEDSLYRELAERYKTFATFYKHAQKKASEADVSANRAILKEYFERIKSGDIPELQKNSITESLENIWNKANKTTP